MNKYQILFLKALRKTYGKCFGGYQLPSLQREEDPDKVSEIIYNILMAPKPCMIARFGSTELSAIVNYLGIIHPKHSVWRYIKGEQPEWWWSKNIMNQMQQWSGFFPPTEDALTKFCRMMLEDAQEVDVLGSWVKNEHYIYDYCSLLMKKVWLIFLDPFWSKNPWTLALSGKKVLVVHPFAPLIQQQYKEKRTLLFDNPNVLPGFSLQAISAVQSLGGNSQYKDWFSALDSMKSQIDECDYDICLIGCGAYGFPLAAHVKRQGKKAVHMGGSLQLLFGIIGSRWENPNYAIKAKRVCPQLSYPSLINEHWIRPNNFKSHNFIEVENGCYW